MISFCLADGQFHLFDRLMEGKIENKKLRQISADDTRVKGVFGPEQVEEAMEAGRQRAQTAKGVSGPSVREIVKPVKNPISPDKCAIIAGRNRLFPLK